MTMLLGAARLLKGMEARLKVGADGAALEGAHLACSFREAGGQILVPASAPAASFLTCEGSCSMQHGLGRS